ncbi:MAG: hypothetical protein WC816_11040 [Sphingomonas sp.]|jgi:hypothetical protein
MRHPVLIVALALLAGCGRGVDATGATPSEAQQLDAAASVLDVNSVDANAIETDVESP